MEGLGGKIYVPRARYSLRMSFCTVPAIDASLTPPSVPIMDGLTTWSPLGSWSGACFAGIGNGCGSTGWVQSDYTIAADGNYFLQFGTINWLDQIYHSGLAISGASLDGVIIEDPVPEPGTLALLGIGVLGMGFMRRRRKV